MEETRYDENIQLKFLDGQIDKLQKELLEYETLGLPEAERIVVDIKSMIELKKKRLASFRVSRIQIAARVEEAKGIQVSFKKDGAAGD